MSDFQIDKVNVFEALGRDKIIELSTCFYKKVYADREPSFRGMFPRDMAGAIQNQYEFFIQRLGGPPEYSRRKGHPALMDRHINFKIKRAHAEKWLRFMHEAMVEVGIAEETRMALEEYFANVAYFLENTNDDDSPRYDLGD